MRLNEAVAAAEAEGAEVGLALLEPVAADLADYHYFHVARGELLARVGRADDAAASFQRALALCPNEVERRGIERAMARRAEEGPAAR